MEKVRNWEQLTGKGDVAARQYVLKMVEGVLSVMDARKRIFNLMKLNGDVLTVGNKQWDLTQKKNIYLFGAGKACNAMAEAVCDILGERITKGIICVKIAEENDQYINTNVYVGGHPLPNEEGMQAAKAIYEMIDQAVAEDLFISVFSGGSSALLTYPVNGITLDDEIVTQDVLLRSGAKILEINAVRRHISQTNGGWMAERIFAKGAEMISLIISDSVGALPTIDRNIPQLFYGTMVAPDGTTIQDARDTIINYNLFDKIPKSVTSYLWNDSRVVETPKIHHESFTSYVLDSVPDSCAEAKKLAEKFGIPIMVLTTFIEGESREVGIVMASIAREIQQNKQPISPPCYVVFSGETTTCLETKVSGKGGPSQELVMGFCLGAKDCDGIAIASIDTEGSDGTTIYAGGLADTKTYNRLLEKGLNPFKVLRLHCTSDALETIGDIIFTGNTGTNVCDFNVMFVDAIK
ncbi:MAG: DUF4147 domain-containing protein [Clostridiaceae bacterium]|nr:DUF4147 domain-containing protein [Clostridiaceae bacterium]